MIELVVPALLAMALATPGSAQTRSAVAVESSSPTISKQCESAKRKVAREQKALALSADGIVRDRRARDACTNRNACARHDSAIDDAQRRMVRREARLARFHDEASALCKPG
jgi:hypothetical protein